MKKLLMNSRLSIYVLVQTHTHSESLNSKQNKLNSFRDFDILFITT